MKVTVNISGLDTVRLGAPLRQALRDALRARIGSIPLPPDARVETSEPDRVAIMPNVPPR